MHLLEFDEIEISGRILSENGQPVVCRLHGVIGTISTKEGTIKVWPLADDDPQLPNDHNGKLWFKLNECEVRLIRRSDD